jgi:hypothetical protein
MVGDRPDTARDVYPLNPNGQGAGPAPGHLAEIAARYTPVDWAAAYAGQPDDIDWLYREWIERGTLVSLWAKPATGKSLLALEASADLVRAGHTVVYIDQENRITDLVERLAAFGCQPAELARLVLYSFADLPPLDSPQGGRHLLALALVHGAALVVIDTATRLVDGKEKDADTFEALYRCSLMPLKARGITVLRLDHPGKDERRGQRGSSAKDEDVDAAWRLVTITEGAEYRLESTKGTGGRSGHGAGAWRLRRWHDPLRHEWSPAEGRSAADAARIAEIISVLERTGVPPEAGRPTAREALKAAGLSAENRLVSEAIRVRKTVRRAVAGSADSDELSAAHTLQGWAAGQSPVPDTLREAR